MDVRVYCDVNFYGSRCNVFCVDRNDDGGHYDCHQGTGQKVCHAGRSRSTLITSLSASVQ